MTDEAKKDVHEVVDGIYLLNGERRYVSDADNARAVAAYHANQAAPIRVQTEAEAEQH